MAVDIEKRTKYLNQDPKAAFLAALQGDQAFLNEYFTHHCWPIMGNYAVCYDKHGHIWYRQWPDIPHGTDLAQFRQIYPPVSSKADITAPFTRYKEKKQGIVKIIEADGGRVEAAMRAFQHIITGIVQREVPQAESMVEINAGLSLFYHGKTPSEISDAEYEETSRLMYQSLAMVGLDPETLISEQKKRIMYWTPKGLTNTDDQGHLNDLISKLARGAGIREGRIRLHKLEGRMIAKYVRGLSDLEVQRGVERYTCSRIVEQLTKPDKIYSPHLGTMIHQLTSFIHLNGLKSAAPEAAKKLNEARDLINAGNRAEAYRKELLPQASKLLSDELAIGEQLMAKLPQMQVQG